MSEVIIAPKIVHVDYVNKVITVTPGGGTGPAGAAATIEVGTVTTGDPGTDAIITDVGTPPNHILDFTIPRGDVGAKGDKGDKGDTGSAGAAATVAVGSTTTGAPGSSASVANSGTSSAAVFDFTIPRGDVGATGPKGDKGDTGDPGVGVPTGGTTGQILAKASGTNYDTQWQDSQSLPVIQALAFLGA